jgi:hypothetical protein
VLRWVKAGARTVDAYWRGFYDEWRGTGPVLWQRRLTKN